MLGKALTTVLAFAATILLLVVPAFALDKLHLKDGRVLEGTIEQETATFVRFVISVGNIKNSQLFTKDEVLKIERDPESTKKADIKADEKDIKEPVEQEKEETAAPSDGATRVAFISLEDEVGMLLNADALLESVERARADKPDMIVLVIDSGGGALAEVEPLSDAIHKTMKKDFRVVGWVRSAISAASLTIFNCEELYMMKEGNIGGTVAYTSQGGRTKALDGANLEQVLRLGEEISKRGKRNPLIMRAMQVFGALSADIDENGEVIWHEGDQGKHLVNPDDRILTFNAIDALKFGISKGTVDTKDELLSAMGIAEWVEVGQAGEKYQKEFRKAVKEVQARIGEISAKYDMATKTAQSASNETDRGLYIGRARNHLNELRSLVRRAPSVEKYMGFDKQWFQDREEELRKMAKRDR
jgi:hypothetical protein